MRTYFANAVKRIERFEEQHPWKSFFSVYGLITGVVLSGLIWYMSWFSDLQTRSLADYVEKVDGQSGFSAIDIRDFAKRAELDSVQTQDALSTIPIDSLRDFGKYFGTAFAFWDDEYTKSKDATGKVTAGILALRYYNDADNYKKHKSMLDSLKRISDSLETKLRLENEYQAKMDYSLSRIKIFPGSLEEYSKNVGYPVHSITLPRFNQIINVSYDRDNHTHNRNENPREYTTILDDEKTKRYLFDRNVEAVVNATPASYGYTGLPVARDSIVN